jgi:hypothetical protein
LLIIEFNFWLSQVAAQAETIWVAAVALADTVLQY